MWIFTGILLNPMEIPLKFTKIYGIPLSSTNIQLIFTWIPSTLAKFCRGGLPGAWSRKNNDLQHSWCPRVCTQNPMKSIVFWTRYNGIPLNSTGMESTCTQKLLRSTTISLIPLEVCQFLVHFHRLRRGSPECCK